MNRISTQPVRYRDLVSPDGSQVDPSIYGDPEIFNRELREVFGRSWLFLGHECMLPEPHSFHTTTMGTEPVIVSRTRDGAIVAHLNVCRHRGSTVCFEDRGTARTFRCRYHGWSYGSDGRLLGLPGEKTLYYDEFDKSAHGLIAVPHVDTYKGLVFGNLDPDAEPLVDALGDAAFYLDTLLDRRSGGAVLLGGQRWRVKANWKAASENHVGDEYHVAFSHASNLPDFIRNVAELLPWAREVRPGYGHGFGVNLVPEDQPLEARFGMGDIAPEALAYRVGAIPEAEQRLGALRARIGLIHGLVWPNLGMVPLYDTLRVFHPIGPDEFELHNYVLVDAEAPPEVRKQIVQRSIAAFGVNGRFEQDDSGNWEGVTRNSAGPVAAGHNYPLTMGLGHEMARDDLPGDVGMTASDICQRGFYLRWAEAMAGAAK